MAKRIPKDVPLADKARSMAQDGKGEEIVDGVSVEKKRGKHADVIDKLLGIGKKADESKPGGKRGRMIRNQTLAQVDAALRLFVYSGVPAVAAAEACGLDVGAPLVDEEPTPEPAPEPAEAATDVEVEENEPAEAPEPVEPPEVEAAEPAEAPEPVEVETPEPEAAPETEG